MRLIVDTNRIIAALVKNSMSRKIINHIDAELIAINFFGEEIQKHKKMLLSKSGLNEAEFSILLEKLKDRMIILNDAFIQNKIREAAIIMDKIDADDTPFVAAALASKADIWSDDAHFEKQRKIKVYKTVDLAKFV